MICSFHHIHEGAVECLDTIRARMKTARLAELGAQVDELLKVPGVPSNAIRWRIEEMRRLSTTYTDQYVRQVRREYGDRLI